MKFTALVPNIFYSDIQTGLRLFVDCLGFQMDYDDLQSEEQPFCVLVKDTLKVHLIESEEFAKKYRPELRLETDNIEEVFIAVKSNFPDLLHPNAKEVVLKPWKVKEFALRDASDVCIVVQEWQK